MRHEELGVDQRGEERAARVADVGRALHRVAPAAEQRGEQPLQRVRVRVVVGVVERDERVGDALQHEVEVLRLTGAADGLHHAQHAVWRVLAPVERLQPLLVRQRRRRVVNNPQSEPAGVLELEQHVLDGRLDDGLLVGQVAGHNERDGDGRIARRGWQLGAAYAPHGPGQHEVQRSRSDEAVQQVGHDEDEKVARVNIVGRQAEQVGAAHHLRRRRSQSGGGRRRQSDQQVRGKTSGCRSGVISRASSAHESLTAHTAADT